MGAARRHRPVAASSTCTSATGSKVRGSQPPSTATRVPTAAHCANTGTTGGAPRSRRHSPVVTLYTATPYAGVLPGPSSPSLGPSSPDGFPNCIRYTRSSLAPAAARADAKAGAAAALRQPRQTRRIARWEAWGTRARQSTATSSGMPGISSTCSWPPRQPPPPLGARILRAR
uniref:Uncharacterized protein n=1 Tax=Zea mays TaxID=4577 RepID=C4IYB2_MAIZE|nr:unknown [Zea mays]ACR36779.1 unknown [Zea mays]